MDPRRYLLVLLVAMLSWGSVSAEASSRRERGPQREQPAAISLDEAIDRAQRRYKARVIRADVREKDGRKTYVLRLLSEDSRVWSVKVDAATGAMN